ncbi:MAG: protein kinase domain-containing protein [Pyrinomonadaceae bacterium]
MANENWQQVREIFDDALRQKSERREGFVNRACGGDEVLLAEVESLLASFDSAEDFLETPAIAKVADQLLTESRQFSNGQLLGHYEIVGQIGAGGMGEVYLARDKQLNRRVALKVLHRNLSADNQANRRLLREAQAAALFDHPNICAIYEISETDDCSFIVMQYVEGETLADILAKERLSVETSLDLAIQIVDALAEAHANHIIHRDIKPANIVVNKKGQAKVLDFGLAKFVEAETGEETVKSLNTSGAVMGTVPYMSPEQLRGKQLDARSDIFSFGAVFYEMVGGRQAFARDNNAETISAILNDQPDWTKIPARLRLILQKSLMKNKDGRYPSARDLARDLQDLRKSGEILSETDGGFDERRQPETVSTSPFEQIVSDGQARPKTRRFYFWQSSNENARAAPETGEIGNKQTAGSKIAWLNRSFILSALTIFLVTGAAVWLVWQFNKNNDSGNFDALRPLRLISWKSGAGSNDSDYRVSHNGKMIAYSSSQLGAAEGIYVKQTADGEEIRVTKDEWRNLSPIWSPDDQRIAFVSVRENQPGIYVSPSFGGTVTPLKITEKANMSLRHWSKDGAAIFYEQVGNLYRLDLTTRETARITDFPDSPAGNDRYFDLSPDEKQIVFCDKRDGQTDVWTMLLTGGEPLRLTNDNDEEIRPRWHTDGKRILYNVRRENDMQINLAFTDARAPVQVTRGEGTYELLDISPDGTKIYYTDWEKRSDIGGVNVESGEEFETAAGIESELWADISPDGKSIVYQTNTSPYLSGNLHKSTLVVKTSANQIKQVLSKGYNPRWLPDSRQLAFVRWNKAEQKDQLWLVNAVSGEEKLLTTDNIISPSIGLMPVARSEIGEFDFSPDGKRFVYINSASPRNIRLGSVDSSETINLTNNNNSKMTYFSPLFSANGKQIVCVSLEKLADKTQKPIWRVLLLEEGKSKEIFSATASLRLLGWSVSGGEIFLETTDGPMKNIPLNVKLIQVSLSGGNRTITALENIYADTMTLASDGKTAAFTARRNDKDDIWTVSLTRGEAKKITANGNTRLFYASPAFSPDGKTILFDKQDQINTISMFENFK